MSRGPTVEAAHEALIDEWTRVCTWVAEARSGIRLHRDEAPPVGLFATFQIEMFKAMEGGIDYARGEIDQWPTTVDLGMNERTEALTRLLVRDQSPVDG